MIIAFDLDDTLYKEADYVASGLRMLARAYPGADLSGRWTPGMLAAFRGHRPDISLDAATESVLEALCRAGHTLALVTDGRSLTQRLKIEALGLDRWIRPRLTLISGETGAPKTTSLPWRMLMNACPGRRRVYVADNPAKDFLQPRRLGWDTVMLLDSDGRNIHPQLIPGPEHSPRHVTADIGELPGLLETERYHGVVDNTDYNDNVDIVDNIDKPLKRI